MSFRTIAHGRSISITVNKKWLDTLNINKPNSVM
jgi:hypothetical protein